MKRIRERSRRRRAPKAAQLPKGRLQADRAAISQSIDREAGVVPTNEVIYSAPWQEGLIVASAVRDNPSHQRFELEANGEMAAAYYVWRPGVITFTHTEVPAALSGLGIGSKLAKGALDLVKTRGVKVVAKCPFISAFIVKHSEFRDMLY